MDAVALNYHSPLAALTRSTSRRSSQQRLEEHAGLLAHDELSFLPTAIDSMEELLEVDDGPSAGHAAPSSIADSPGPKDASGSPPDLGSPQLPPPPMDFDPDTGHESLPAPTDLALDEATVDDLSMVGLPASFTGTQGRDPVDPIRTSSPDPQLLPSEVPLPPSPLPSPLSNLPPPPQPPPPPHPPPPLRAPPPPLPPSKSHGVTWKDASRPAPPDVDRLPAMPVPHRSPKQTRYIRELDPDGIYYPNNRSRTDASSTSGYTSPNDAIIIENDRHFPPRLPTAPPFSKEHSRTRARKKISTWIARYESSQGTRSDRLVHRGASLGLDDDLRSPTFSNPSDSSSSSSSEVEIEDLWRRMKSKRSQMSDFKSQMAQMRKRLKDVRGRKNAADNAFMSLVRPVMVHKASLQSTSASDLEQRMLEMQRLRDEYQELETGYEELEDRLGDEEEQLHQIELHFFSLLSNGDYDEDLAYSSQELEPIRHEVPSDVPFELLGIAAEKPLEDLHPHFVGLTLAIASLHNEREELSNLLETKKQCDAEVDVKMRVGQKIPKDILEFLSDFRTLEAMKKDEVASDEQEVARLRGICEQQNIMGKHLSIHMAMALDPKLEFEDFRLSDEAAILATHDTMAHQRFPDLLSQPDHLLADPFPLLPQQALHNAEDLPADDPQRQTRIQIAEKEHHIQQLMASIDRDEDKAGYINRWLLHDLRTSPLNAALLHSTFHSTFAETLKLKIRDPSRWQTDVLRYWWRDNTATAVAHFDELDRGSQYYSRVGTPPPTRAASEILDAPKAHHSHRRAWSGGVKSHKTY